MAIPFGMTEAEWNKFCDSQKCQHGYYRFIGQKPTCPKCVEAIERLKEMR